MSHAHPFTDTAESVAHAPASQGVLDLLRAEKAASLLGGHVIAGDAVVLVAREHLLDVMQFLRDDPRLRMEQLMDVTAVDFLEFAPQLRRELSPVDADHASGLTSDTLPRYEVVYHLLSMSKRHRLRVKVPVTQDDPHVPTLTHLWMSADWGEREAWDMYGIVFDGHPDPRRILMYEEFEGHPLRKDYPLRGYQPLVAMPELVHYTDHETFR
jgi:NADH-quinone oxidoreductase subunit C